MELGKRLGAISKISYCLLLVPVIVIGAVAFGRYGYWFKDDVKKEEPVKEENSIRKEDNRIPRLERL